MDGTRKVDRETIKKEVEEDLKKPYGQLLEDIYDEILNQATQDDALIHSFKRMSSLFAKIGMNAEKISNQIRWLTVILVIFTILIALLTILSFFK